MNFKNIIVFSVLACGINTPVFSQNTKSITDTDIEGVKVFLNNAQVTRSAKVNVEQGSTALTFSGLSAFIDQPSISVTGKGNITILSVQYQLDFLEHTKKSLEVKLLEDSLKSTTYKLDELKAKRQVLEDEQTMVMANKSVGGANTGVTADNLTKVADFFMSRLTDIKTNILKISLQEKIVTERITNLNNQLNDLNNNGDKPSGTIIVNVKAETKVAADIELAYVVSEAGWNPLYDVRAKDVKSPVQLSYKANVHQNSGEDWKNVKLTLSTGNPSQGGNKPELFPWYLNMYERRMYKTMRSPSIMMEAAPMADSVNMDKQAKSTASYTAVVENQLSTDFAISIPYTLPSNGKEISVDIQNYSLNADYKYYSIPKLDKDVFLTANITGWGDLNLLSGNANVYFDGTYIGESYINTTELTDTLSLPLGRDKKIIVKREKLKEYSSTKIFSDKKQKDYSYEISVRNNKKEAVTVILEDQVPVSQNKEIEVKVNDTSGASYNAETGKLTWNVTIQPGAELKEKFSFSVKYPANQNIPNL